MVLSQRMCRLYTLSRIYASGMEDIVRMGIVDFRKNVGNRVDAAHFLKEPTIITKGLHEEPRAMLIPYEWLHELEEALQAQGIEPPPKGTNQAKD